MPTTANSILVGSTFGIAILCRPTFIVWFALAGLASLATKFREFRAWPAMQIVVASLLVVLTPWIVRNQFTLYPPGSRSVWTSRPVFATTHGGYTLLLGNNPSFYDHLDEPADGRDWPAENPTFQGEMRAIQFEAIEQYRIDHHELPPADNYLETYLDRVCYEHASDAIADRPTSFLWACALRITWLWTPLAHPTTDPEPVARKTLRFASALWFALIYLALGFGLIHWRTVPSNESSTAPAARSAADADAARQPTRLAHPWLYGILFCLALTVLHTFFWSNLRMRAPLIPILSLLAAYGLERFVDIWSPSKRSLPAAEIN